MIKQVDIHSRGKCQAWLGPLARRFLTYMGRKQKMWVDCFVKGRQMQPEEGRSEIPMVSGAWSPWAGGREKGRPGRRASGGRPLGAPSCLLWLGTQRERGWVGGLGPSLCRGRTTDLKTTCGLNELQLVKGFEAERQSLSTEDSFS